MLGYREEASRIFETRDARLRSFSAAALAIGLGGTMVALIVGVLVRSSGASDLLSNPGSVPAAAQAMELVHGMGLALFGSLSGVAANLIIVLFLIPIHDRRYEKAEIHFYKEVNHIMVTTEVEVPFAKEFRTQMRELRDAMGGDTVGKFVAAMGELPGAVKGMGDQVAALTSLVKAQEGRIQTTLTSLVACAEQMGTSVDKFAETSGAVTQTAEQLAGLPGNLRQVLARAQDEWSSSMLERWKTETRELIDLHAKLLADAQQREKQMMELAKQLSSEVAYLKDAVNDIPEGFRESFSEAGEKIAERFGRSAESHVAESRAALEEEFERFKREVENLYREQAMDQHSRLEETRELLRKDRKELLEEMSGRDKELRADFGRNVESFVGQLGASAADAVAAPLQKLGEETATTLDALADAAKRLEEANAAWAEFQRKAMADWQSVAKSTESMAQGMATASSGVGTAVRGLGQSAEQLRDIAKGTLEFEQVIRAALKTVSDEHLRELNKVHGDLHDLAMDLRTSHLRMNHLMKAQSALVDRILTGMAGAAGPRPAPRGEG